MRRLRRLARSSARTFGLILVSIALSGSALLAQTTGGISGRVSDTNGGPLPGVQVEAKSPALQGVRTVTSDESGRYKLSLLPPGAYTVSFTLQGFAPDERSGITVGLAREVTLDIGLGLEQSEEIFVVDQVPVIDLNSAGLGTNLDTLAIETLPTGRNYAAVVQIAPGVSSDAHPENGAQSTITVYGSTGAENAFLIDGVNTTGVEYGFQGKELNFEFIEAIDVKTGGYEAEFGRSTGGIINVITKSGGNAFSGDVFAYRDDDGFQNSAKPIVATSGVVEGFTREDYGADVGGYVVKDKLWFFGAFDRVEHSSDSALTSGPRAGEIATSESERDLAALKLTASLAGRHTLIGSFFQDPRDDTGAINDASHTLNGDALTYEGLREFGGKDYAVRYEGILGPNWLVSGQLARHEEENSVGPAGAEGDVVQFRDVANDFFQTGGFGLIQDKEFQRDFVGASATWLIQRHEIKFGIEAEEQDAQVTRRMSGGQQVDVIPNPIDPARPIYRHFYWTTPDATLANAPISALVAAPSHENTTVFLQDRWQVRPNLTLSLGVRWDRQEIIDAGGTRQLDLDKDFAPRLGFIWDPDGTAKSRVIGSYGRFYEQIPMDLVIRSFSFERQPRIINFDPLSNVPDATAEAILGTESAILGGFTEPSDPNLKNQYINEFVLGYEREVRKDLAIGIKGIYRDYGEVIEDFLCADDGTYCIGNPSKGIMQRVFTLDYSRTFPAPEPKRVYKGVQLDAHKRFSDNWQALASYVYSKLDGNFDGLYAPFTNVGADPNITAAYDYFDFFTDGQNLGRITNEGPLSNDRRHQFKVSGIYQTPFKLSVGVAAFYKSGTPVTRYGYSDAYGRYEFFLSERGLKAARRPPTTWTCTWVTRSSSRASRSTCCSTSSACSTPNARSCSINAGVSRSRTTASPPPPTQATKTPRCAPRRGRCGWGCG